MAAAAEDAAAPGDAKYQAERAQLLADIVTVRALLLPFRAGGRRVSRLVQSAGELLTNVKALNRTMEGLNHVGQGFERMAQAWVDFHRQIKESSA